MGRAVAQPDFSDDPGTKLPCQFEPDLWFADTVPEIELAKSLCAKCALKDACLSGALERAEPWGVWGGEIFVHGAVVTHRPRRGRPRRTLLPRGTALVSTVEKRVTIADSRRRS
ncbi:WhiB family transcriptional regulator [Catellatospora sp. NPDC049609]|uniref:WhiB family transcriptional regulator n=1 Tax=Catellatospora sp. NPDC049609 TaxID=3155505 RepID=UPI003435E73D